MTGKMIKRLIAAALAAALLLELPGLPAYRACAAVFENGGKSTDVHALPGAALPGLPSLPAPVSGLGAAPIASAPSPDAARVESAAAPDSKSAPVAQAPAASAAATPSVSGGTASGAPNASSSDEAQAVDAARRFDGAAASADNGPAGAPTPPSGPQGSKLKLPRSVVGLYIGHHVLTVFGINFHIISQPFLVKDAMRLGTGSMGVIRNVHMGAMALVNALPVGALIDKTDFRVVFIATSIVRAALMGAIPLLFYAHVLPFTALAAIIAVNPLFQSVMVVADGAAFKTFVGRDEKLNKDATAKLSKWDSISGAIMPLLAGWAVGALVSAFGLGGYALGYGVYATLLLAAIPVYWKMIRDPRFPQNDSMGFGRFLFEVGRFMAVLMASIFAPLRGLWRWLRAPRGKTAASEGAPAKGGSLADRLERVEALQGFAFILRNRVLKVLAMVMAVEMFALDAMPFVILPSLITEAFGKAPQGLPFGISSFLATAGGILGLLSAIEYVGRFIPSSLLEGARGDALIARFGAKRFYRITALGSLLFWALLVPVYLTTGNFWANLAVAGGTLFAVQLLQTPLPIVMAPIKRSQMDDSKLGRIDSAFFMIDVAMEAAGALLLGLVVDAFGLGAGLITAGTAFTLAAAFEWMVPHWLGDALNPKPAAPTPPQDSDPPQA